MNYSQHKRCECDHTRSTHNNTKPNKVTGEPGGYRKCTRWECECKEYTPAGKRFVGHDGCPV